AAMITPGGSYYYSYDPNGNVSDLTDSTGATQWAYSYEPFGLIRSATNVSGSGPTNPFQYAGQYTDSGTSLSDMRARQYDPNTGTFLSMDPDGQQTTLSSSLYVYGSDSPLVYSDPSGLGIISALEGIGSDILNGAGEVSYAIGDAATAVANAVNSVVVQPTVQLAKTDFNCMTGNGAGAGACTAAALQTGLMLLPGVKAVSVGVDALATSTSLFRASLRETASNIGSAISDGLYKFGADEAESLEPGATIGRGATEDTGPVGPIADTQPTQAVSQRISQVTPEPNFAGDTASSTESGIPESVFRGDTRSPSEIEAAGGFQPRAPGSPTSLEDYVLRNEPSNYVGASKLPEGAAGPQFSGPGGYVYEVSTKGLSPIDVNAALGPHVFSAENEVAFPGGIPFENILRAYEVHDPFVLGPEVPAWP